MSRLLKVLRQESADLTREWRDLREGAAKTADKRYTEDQVERVKAIRARLKDIDAEIQDEEALLNQEAQMDSFNREVATVTPEATDPGPWGGFGEQLNAIASVSSPGGFMDPRLIHHNGGISAAASGGSQAVPSEGGFTVEPEYSGPVWDGLNNAPDSLFALTDRYTVTGESLTFKANDETSRATGSRYGGVQGYWIAEAAQITDTKPKFREMKLEPQELAVMIYMTDKLLRNSSIAMGQYVTKAAVEEVMFLVGDAIINGDGSGKPLGIMNSPCLVTQAKETGQDAATIEAANISKMWARLHAKARTNAVWFYNVEIEPQLDQLAFDIGTSGQLMYMGAGGLKDAAEPRLKGRRMIPIEYSAALGTTGDLILADLGYYATGTTGAVRNAMSMHIRFDYAETAFRIMWEIDGQPWLASALTPYKGSSTLSPFVALATRS